MHMATAAERFDAPPGVNVISLSVSRVVENSTQRPLGLYVREDEADVTTSFS